MLWNVILPTLNLFIILVRRLVVHKNCSYLLDFIVGLVLKKQGNYDEALECFQKFSGSLALLPSVVYHTATLLELMGDSEAAADTYQQLLGLVPSDASVLQKLGELYDHEGDKQQAHHYHVDVSYVLLSSVLLKLIKFFSLFDITLAICQ